MGLYSQPINRNHVRLSGNRGEKLSEKFTRPSDARGLSDKIGFFSNITFLDWFMLEVISLRGQITLIALFFR